MTRGNDDEVNEFLQHKQPGIVGHRDCDLCDNDHEDEVTKNWLDTGWDVCQTCLEQGVAEEALLDETRTLDHYEAKWCVDLCRNYKKRAELAEKDARYWMKLAHELRDELAGERLKQDGMGYENT